MANLGAYDPILHQFKEEQKTLSFEHLTFLRWLAERGLLEQEVHGPSVGLAAQGHARRVLAYAGKSS